MYADDALAIVDVLSTEEEVASNGGGDDSDDDVDWEYDFTDPPRLSTPITTSFRPTPTLSPSVGCNQGVMVIEKKLDFTSQSDNKLLSAESAVEVKSASATATAAATAAGATAATTAATAAAAVAEASAAATAGATAAAAVTKASAAAADAASAATASAAVATASAAAVARAITPATVQELARRMRLTLEQLKQLNLTQEQLVELKMRLLKKNKTGAAACCSVLSVMCVCLLLSQNNIYICIYIYIHK